MSDKRKILDALTDVFNQYEALLNGLSPARASERHLPSNWSVKDVLTHLWAWQQVSVARAQAALHNGEPEFPAWWRKFAPDPEEDVDRTNAWIYESNRDKPWQTVYADWKSQFQHYLELANEVPEQAMLQPGRYAWMGSYSLSDSIMGSVEHHQEHIDELRAWLGQ